MISPRRAAESVAAGRILVRRRQIEQRRRSRCGNRSAIKPSLVDGHTCNFGARELRTPSAAPLIAGIFDNAERAAREEQVAPAMRQAFLHAGDDHDPRGVGDNAARCRQMIGDRGAQRGKPRRIAVLREARRAAVGKVRLQQAPPGLERKQLRAGPAGKEIEQQAIAGGCKALCTRP